MKWAFRIISSNKDNPFSKGMFRTNKMLYLMESLIGSTQGYQMLMLRHIDFTKKWIQEYECQIK